MKNRRKTLNKGFTLVEIIIVLVIMGIVGAVAVPSVINYTKHTAERSCKRLMNETMGNIRATIVSQKYSESAEVSLDIHKILNALPLMRMNIPSSVRLAEEDDRSFLSQGTITGAPLDILLSPANATTEDERYTVNWSFSETSVSISMSCNKHEVCSMSDTIPISYGRPLGELFEPQEVPWDSNLYNALTQLLGMVVWNGDEGTITVDETGETFVIKLKNKNNITGHRGNIVDLLNYLYGEREIQNITEFRIHPSTNTPWILRGKFADGEKFDLKWD